MLEGPSLGCRRRFYMICYPRSLVFFKGISAYRHIVCLSDEVLYVSLFPLPAVHSVSFYPETSTVFQLFSCDSVLGSITLCSGSLLYRFSCQTGVWTHRVSMFSLLALICLQSYCFHLRTQICSASSSGHIMHIQMLSEISLAMHIWQLLHAVIFVFSFVWRSWLRPSQILSAPLPCPQLKSQGLVSFSLKTICATASTFFWFYVYSFLYFRDLLNKFQKLSNLLHWMCQYEY